MSQPSDNTDYSGDNDPEGTDGWVPDSALSNFVTERTMHPEESNVQTTKRLLDENAPLVVQSVIRLAMYSKSERTRLDAGKYILDRVLGKIEAPQADDDSPLNKFVNDITEFVAAAADNRSGE